MELKFLPKVPKKGTVGYRYQIPATSIGSNVNSTQPYCTNMTTFLGGGEEQQFSCVLTDGEKKLQIRLSWQNCFYQISSHQHKERSDLEIGSTEKKNFTFRSGPPSTTSPMLATASRPYQEILSSVLCY